MRSGRKPERVVAVLECHNLGIESPHRCFTLELIDIECDAHMKAVPVDDAVREHLPLRYSKLPGQLVESRYLIAEVVDADAIDAGVESIDGQALDQHSIGERLDHIVAQLEVGQPLGHPQGKVFAGHRCHGGSSVNYIGSKTHPSSFAAFRPPFSAVALCAHTAQERSRVAARLPGRSVARGGSRPALVGPDSSTSATHATTASSHRSLASARSRACVIRRTAVIRLLEIGDPPRAAGSRSPPGWLATHDAIRANARRWPARPAAVAPPKA